MSSDEDFDPTLPKKKQWKKNKMPVCFDSDNQNDSDILEETEQSLSEQTSYNLMINDENINGFSDSDEDFDIHVRTKKNTRPLTDSENELVLDDLTTEKISKETKQINSLEISEKDWESDSSNGQSEKCPICLSKFLGQEIGNPESCDHSFCLDCLLEWAKKVNTCPVDRLPFMLILVQQKLQGNIIRRIPATNWKSVDSWLDQEQDDSDLTYCEICGQCNQEDRLLLCDSCDLGYHCECLDPPLDNIPVGEWFCPNCDSSKSDECNLSEELMADFQEMLRSRFRPRSSIFHPRIIARTSAIETVRHRVQRRREAQLEEIRNSLSPHIINREKNRNFISRRNKSNRLSVNFSVRDRRMRRIIAEQSPLITSVTKRRFAQRLGLQRTACGILHGSDLSYSYYLDNEQFQDEDASYDSSSNEDSYLFDNIHGCTSYNYKQSTSSLNNSPAKSSSRLRIRVPSPQVNHRNILNEILETQSLLHSNSQNITIEKDGSLKLSDCTQQRPQNPLQQSTSTDKNKTIPSSTTCSPESSHSESRINQWYGNERELVTSANHNRNYYEDQQSGNYGSNLCVDKKKEYHHSRTKETKTQSEDEVDIYSDIESLGDEIIEDELDSTTNEQCNITNVYRCDLQHDNMEEDSDSSENELIIDEDVKVEEEDSHSVVWNEENTRCSLEEENSQNNFLLKNDMPKFETTECSNDNIENSGLSQIADIPSQIVCEEKISDSSNSRNFSQEEMIDDDDDEDDGTTMNDDEALENMEQDYTFSEEDGKSDNIKTEESFSVINRTSKIEKNLKDDKNINKADIESLSSISNEQINVEDSLSSVANESIQKLHVEDNFLLSSGLEKKLSLIRNQQFDEINKISFLQEDNLSKSLNIINTCEETCHLIENKTDESDDNISNEDEYFIEKQSLNISDIKEEDKNLDTNQTSLSAIDYVYSTPENDHHIPVKVTTEEDENESQDSSIIYSEEGKRIDSSFKEEFYENESHFKSDRNKCIKMKENLNEKNEVTEPLPKSSHYSILPAEDVEDISEAGSDDTKFKDESDDYEIDQICDDKRDDTVEHCEINKKQLDEVEKRVAKLFENEDTSYIEENVLSNNKQNRLKSCAGEKSYSYEDEREEGEIVEEVPHVVHRIRCRKSHHRELSHQEELEDYGDHAPRINISDLPRIPKIKREKKSEIPEETNIDPKRLSVLSRVDSGNINEISWKKLSRSTRERSYRDGRPKDSRLLFREREIKQKIKNDEEKSKKDDENKRKEDKYKRLDNDKWREKTELEHLKDRRDRQKEILYEKSEKKVEKEWKIDKFDDKKESKEKFYEKSYRDEKNHRDKHKHKHRDSKDHKSEKDKFQDKYAHTHIRHSHEREHTKLKDRKIKKIDIDKKDNRKEKIEKSGDKKGNKHEKKHEDESRNYYEHKKQDDLYPEITAIESKEIYAKGDSIIINVSFNRNTDQDQNIMDDINSSQKDTKKSKLKDKFPIDQRKDKLDGKHCKQKHFSALDGMDHTKLFKSYEKKQSAEKVQIGQMLWKETEEIRQTQEIGNKCSTDCDNSDKFERDGSPISDISGQELGKITDLHNTDILSPYNDKNIPVSPATSYESPKQRSPQFPSPPSPTENDSYDPCDPTRSPFLQKHSPSLTNNTYSVENKPKPPPSPELPPLPLDPEPLTHLPSQDINSLSSCLTDKRNLSDLSSVSTSVSCNSLGPSQPQQFTLPNVKIPPPNYIPQVSNIPSNTNVQSLLPNIQNWNIYSSHNNQSLMQGSFIPSHLSQGTMAQLGTLIPSSVPRLISPQHPHSSGQVMTFIPAVPNIRVPPPMSSQVAVNLNQQSHMMHTFVPNKMHSSEGQLPSNISSNIKKSTSDVTEVIDMEVDSPYNSPNINKSGLQHSPKTDKFDMILTSGSKSHSQITTNEKKQQDNIKILAEKVKHSQLLSKTVITALDRMNKKIASKVEASRCSAKRSKLDSKSEIVKIRHSRSDRSDAIKLSVPHKKELKLSEKKEIMIRMDESQLTILEDLPSSAVEMQVKEKFLKKLNRQERVVEEVKLALKPYYSRREIDKEEYKEIMRKSVPKVCHNRSGDINPVKIKILIEGYIKKFKHQQKKTGKLQKTKIS